MSGKPIYSQLDFDQLRTVYRNSSDNLTKVYRINSEYKDDLIRMKNGQIKVLWVGLIIQTIIFLFLRVL